MLNKQPLDLRFGQGLDLKSDPNQIPIGKLLSLENVVFNKGGLLQKRNGFKQLTSLPDTSSTFLSTFNGGLTAIGTSLYSLSAGTDQWIDKGSLEPADLSVLSLIRSGSSQTQCDAVVAPNGLVCTVYTDTPPSGTVYKYSVADSSTGQNIIMPTPIPSGSGTVTGTTRVFLMDNYFIIVYTNVISTVNHLQFVAISISNPTLITTPADVTSSYIPATTLSWDGIVVNNSLYVAYNTTTGGQAIQVTYINSSLIVVSPTTFSGEICTLMSMASDLSNPAEPIIYVNYYDLVSTTGKTLAIDSGLNHILAPTTTITSTTVLNIASSAQSGICTFVYEVANNYGYDSGIPTNYLKENAITQSGTVGTSEVLLRSVGLASKAIVVNNTMYFLAIYYSNFQPTYFLVTGQGKIVSKLAYSNAAHYLTTGLPTITYDGESSIQVSYLLKDLLQSVNKTQGVANAAGVYTQTGINLASYTLGSSALSVGEIGQNLNLSGGFVWSFDGVSPVEQGFFLWPDSVEATPLTSGGSMTDQQYYYQVTYEWTDNQGNIFRSAPSIPTGALVSGGSGSGSVTLNIPTLRLTYKTATPVRIVIYRWSAAQQTYYQLPNAIIPVNSLSVDYVTVTDTYADSVIIGDNIIYTTGGVVEDIAPPATSIMTLFNNRLWLVDAEDPNLLWFSKQVIEATPVEMSDLLTLYVAPSTASQGSTGPITALGPMDDKLIVFKANALGYISGTGPDNTGANSQYSDFVLINSTVGCANQQSIVFMPQGIMFQSDKGIWLLGRDLSTQYIGAPVEAYNSYTVLSALNVPATNQVRFTMSNGTTLIYDYYFGQWGTFTNVPAISSAIYQTYHTYIDSYGRAFQETPNMYLDGSNPVLIALKTGWINVAGLQGYERFYQMLLLGNYYSPFNLTVQLAYNYNPSPVQSTNVTPDAYPANWGGEQLWGSGTPWGGSENGNVFQARVFPQIQKCESFQVSIQESYYPGAGIAAGQGLSLSGMNLLIGYKKGTRTSKAARSFG